MFWQIQNEIQVKKKTNNIYRELEKIDDECCVIYDCLVQLETNSIGKKYMKNISQLQQNVDILQRRAIQTRNLIDEKEYEKASQMMQVVSCCYGNLTNSLKELDLLLVDDKKNKVMNENFN